MKVSLDTNILISDPRVVLDKQKEFVISFTVIRELDNLKRNPDLKRAAQSAIVNIYHQYLDGKIEILNIPEKLGESPDERIIADTKIAGASMLSDDIAVRLIAHAHGVPVSSFEADDEIDHDYLGYTTIQGDVEYEKHYVPIKEMPLAEFDGIFDTDLKENEYCIIDRVVEKNDIWHNYQGKVSRISQSTAPLKDAGVMDVPLDSPQACVIHAVMDPRIPLVVIDGKVGSGKTILALMGALATTVGQSKHSHYNKIMVTRPPTSVNSNYRLGFLPGDLGEKLGDWIGGIKSNLKFLLEKEGAQKKAKIADELFEEVFELVNLDSIQGLSVHDNIFMVDEWQLLEVDMLKLVLTRISEGAKVIVIGDTRDQTYGVNRANEGFKVLYRHLGKAPEMSFIRLENIYRSALVRFIEEVFND